jgi:hypothetical protein
MKGLPLVQPTVYLVVKVGSNKPEILFPKSQGELQNPKFGQELEFVLYEDDRLNIKLYHAAGERERDYVERRRKNETLTSADEGSNSLGSCLGSCVMLLEELGKPGTTTIVVGSFLSI